MKNVRNNPKLLRLLLIAGLLALLFTVFTVSAAADTDIAPGTYSVFDLLVPQDGTLYSPANNNPYVSGRKIVLTAFHLKVNGTSHNGGEYTPTLQDNIGEDVELEVIARPADGYQWQNGDPTQFTLKWVYTDQTATGVKMTGKYAKFVYKTHVRGTINNIDITVPVPAAGALSNDTLGFTAADDHAYTVKSVTWRLNDSGNFNPPPAVWQGGTSAKIRIYIAKLPGCEFGSNLKIKLNGTDIPIGTTGNAYYNKGTNEGYLFYTFDIADTLSGELDLANGAVTVTNPDYKYGLAEQYLNTLLTLSGTVLPTGYSEGTYNLDLNGDDKTDLTLAYKPRIPSGSNIRKSTITITPGEGLWRALNSKTERAFTLTEDQQAVLAGNSKVFWQKLTIKTASPKVTIHPNGGTLKNGSTAPFTLQTDAEGKLKLDQLTAYLTNSTSADFGMTRTGFFAYGFNESATADTPFWTSLSDLCKTYSKDVTWYVVWKKQIEITLDPNGGAFKDGTKTPITMKCDRSGYLLNDETHYDKNATGYGMQPPAGYGYDKLAYKKDGTNVISSPYSTRFTDGDYVYVIWYKIIKLTIDPNGGAFPDGTTEPKTFDLPKNNVISYTQYDEAGFNNTSRFKREGYLMRGLSETKDGAPVCENTKINEYLRGNGLSSGRVFTQDTTLYIRWVKAINVTLDLNGGAYFLPDGNKEPMLMNGPITLQAAAGEKLYLNEYTPVYVKGTEKPVGWSTSASGKPIAADLSSEAWIATPEKDTVLYLAWETPSVLEIRMQPNTVMKKANGMYLHYGDSVTFTVFAAGPGLRYQWQSAENGEHLYLGGGTGKAVIAAPLGAPAWKDMSGQTGASLTVKAGIEDTKGRVFRCVIKDENGVTRETDTVWCDPVYEFIRQPESFAGQPGETAAFRVAASAPAPTYIWKVYDKDYHQVNTSTISGLQGENDAVLTFPITSALDGYRVECEVYDTKLGAKLVSSKAGLTVGKGINEIAITLSPLPKEGDPIGGQNVKLPADFKSVTEILSPGDTCFYKIINTEFLNRCRRYGALGAIFTYAGPVGEFFLEPMTAGRKFEPGAYLLYVPLTPKDGAGQINAETVKVTFNGKVLARDADWYFDEYAVAYLLIEIAAPHVHKLVQVNEVAPTCGNPGAKACWQCSECKKLFSDSKGVNEITAPEAIPATGKHSWDKGEVTKQPTLTAVGEKTFRCLVCGASKTEKIPMLSPDDPTPPSTDFMLGDVDNDGIVKASDARLALRAAVKLETYAPGSRAFLAADVNLDERITSADARLILRRAVKLIDKEFGVKY